MCYQNGLSPKMVQDVKARTHKKQRNKAPYEQTTHSNRWYYIKTFILVLTRE